MKTIILSFVLTTLFFISCKTPQPVDISIEMGLIENGLLPEILVKGVAEVKYNILERMELHKVPGASIAIVKNGKLVWAKGYGIANTSTGIVVDEKTLFQAGSISKPVAALSALKLVEEGKIDLDQDVNTYLGDWKVPESKFLDNEKVTLRRLLTHTAGMTVHGFPGYQQTDTFPSITEVLNGNGNTPSIFVDTFPGSIWRYSGGGYTIMEKLVEDVSGLPLEEYMRQYVLDEIEMTNSTYEQPLPLQLHAIASAAYDNEGNIIEGLWHNYPEQAAAGLWTTPTDLAKYCIEIQEIVSGKKDGVLSQGSIDKMLTKHKNDWGLGPSLTWKGDSLRFQHGGKNAGFTNNMIASAYQGYAVIIMTNADNGGKLIGEILRSISSYYELGISTPKIVEPVEISKERLSKLVGKYLYDGQVPEIGDYFVNLSVEDGKLVIYDPNEEEKFYLTPLGEMKFIDIEKGDEIVFEGDEAVTISSFLWNERFQFNLVE